MLQDHIATSTNIPLYQSLSPPHKANRSPEAQTREVRGELKLFPVKLGYVEARARQLERISHGLPCIPSCDTSLSAGWGDGGSVLLGR